MGWASGGEIFDDVTQALIDAGVHGEQLTSTCEKMIEQFRDMDWDTEEESLETFQDSPDVVEAFRRHDIHADGRSDLVDLFVQVFRVDRSAAEHVADKILPVVRRAVTSESGTLWQIHVSGTIPPTASGKRT
jgi:O-phosphoseryl-tRNA(Cys) synthetase